jgi:hypothetical protein
VRTAVEKFAHKEEDEAPDCTYMDFFEDDVVQDLIDFGHLAKSDFCYLAINISGLSFP